MVKTLLLPATIFTFFSCTKTIEDRLIGQWKLDGAYKKDFWGRDYFKTGFEDGVFILYESGSAAYISSAESLSGYWKSDYYWASYDPNTGDPDSRRLKYLEIFLANFQRNKILHWQFDEFNFRNNWKEIRAKEHTLGRDRYYEFVRQ